MLTFVVSRDGFTEICYFSVMAKSLNIKNPEVTALLAELTEATGKGSTELILDLLKREAEHRRKFLTPDKRRKRIDSILRRAQKKIPKNAPPTEKLIQYDKRGLPR